MATFVGNANILKGVVKKSSENNSDDITITTESGEVQVSTASAENLPQPGETVTIAVRSENIRFEESINRIQRNPQENESECAEKIAHESTQKHMFNTNSTGSIQGLIAEVIEKTFAGGQLRVVLKTIEGQEIIASRYGIDTNVNVGETVRCCFKPSDAVLVDRPEINTGVNMQESNTQKVQKESQSSTGGPHA